jgi:hypothetical protein
MPVSSTSRHVHTLSLLNSEDLIHLTDRIPFRFVNITDNIYHTVIEHDTLYHLAAKYFKGIDRPAGLWWVIADFQLQPIHDPTIKLLPGSSLIIPSLRTVQEKILSVKRRRDSLL